MKHRQQLTIGGKAKWVEYKSAQELVDMVTAQAAGISPTGEVTFGDYAREWYHTYKEPELSAHTANGFESKLRVHILPYMGNKPINSIRWADVQVVVDSCTSASSAKWARSIVNMVMDAAISDELYTHPNPAKDKRIVMPKNKTKRTPLANDDVSKIMEVLPTLSKDIAPLFALMFMTGCRRGEALGARWEDIDWQRNTIHLQRVVRFSSNQPDVSRKMKTPSANRTVSLWPEFIPYLGKPKESGYIVESEGEPLSERQYRTRWRKLQAQLQEAGISERFTAHQLRHTYATVAANSGKIPPKVLQGMLGHANFQTTMNIYAGLDTDQMRESSLQLGAEYVQIATKVAEKLQANQTG